MLAINEAIRPIANIVLADTLSAFIRQLEVGGFLRRRVIYGYEAGCIVSWEGR
jgi:hypothetical protein